MRRDTAQISLRPPCRELHELYTLPGGKCCQQKVRALNIECHCCSAAWGCIYLYFNYLHATSPIHVCSWHVWQVFACPPQSCLEDLSACSSGHLFASKGIQGCGIDTVKGEVSSVLGVCTTPIHSPKKCALRCVWCLMVERHLTGMFTQKVGITSRMVPDGREVLTGMFLHA